MERLFVDEDYQEETFDVGVTQRLLCLRAACTDHDLTGQVVWPVSVFLACLVAESDFRDKRVVELGAGCGLPGLVASQSAAKVALTDGSDVVLDLLKQTVTKFQVRATVSSLVWGDRHSTLTFKEAFGSVDVVLGADVVCWPNLVEPLLQTVVALLDIGGVFYCGFVCRATSTRDLFFEKAMKYGVTVQELPFTPKKPPPNTTLPLQILRVTKTQETPVVFLSDDPDAYETTLMAC